MGRGNRTGGGRQRQIKSIQGDPGVRFKPEKTRPYLAELKASIDSLVSEKLESNINEEEKDSAVKFYTQVFEKLAEAKFFYHVAPTTSRQRILQHGLQVSEPGKNEAWGTNGALAHQPAGVYLVIDESTTASINGLLASRENDIWRVPANSIQELAPDWEIISAYSTPRIAAIASHNLNAELFRGYEESMTDSKWDKSSGAPTMSFRDEIQMLDEMELAEEYLNRP